MKIAPRYSPKLLLVNLIAAGCLLLMAVYCYAYFWEFPYLGFELDSGSEAISNLAGELPADGPLSTGDILLKIDGKDFGIRSASRWEPLFPDLAAGDVTRLTIQRGEQILQVAWTVPGITLSEVGWRLSNFWYLSAIYWIFGLLTVILIHPHDERWGLMIALFFLVGLWIMFGVASNGKVWYSSLLLRMITWPMMAVSLHFHWVFPQPLGRIPRQFLAGFYLFFFALSFIELQGWLPPNTYLLGTGLLALASLALLLLHIWKLPASRRQVNVVLVSVAICLMVVIPIGLGFYFLNYKLLARYFLFFLLLMPLFYFYALYASQTGEMEFRRSRVLGLASFTVMLFAAAVLIILLVRSITQHTGLLVMTGIFLAALSGLVGALFYPAFQQRFDRAVLRAPLLPPDLLPRYSARLAESLGVESVIELLRDLVLPGLMVNQAVLLRFRPDELAASTQEAEVLLAYGVKLEQVPGPDGLLALQHKAGQQREIAPGARTEPDPAPWVRLVLPLLVGSRWVGMCLLGRKDPDDFYTPDEITLLQALMTQTALALVHIEQAARLRLYYQADIQRQEDERQNLARELHDHLLGQMALLIQHAGDSQESEAFLKAYRSAVQDIRSIISGLRPAALTYGLVPALEELTDELNDTPIDGGPPVEVWCSLKSEQARYPEDVELHLYRIVQQACQNALQHAAPGEIKLRGVLDENGVVLSVTDDGVGFVTPRTPDLAALLAHRQYGLVGMIERAGLIQAELTIDSAPGQGTRISITWQAHPAGL